MLALTVKSFIQLFLLFLLLVELSQLVSLVIRHSVGF